MILYGIASCDTCRKALAALRSAAREVEFRDVRTTPLAPEELERFIALFDTRLVNRSSTTWRSLSEGERGLPVAELLARHPAVMKRPVIAEGAQVTLGWDQTAQAAWL